MESQEVLFGLNPYGEQFPLHAQALIQALCVRLDLNYATYENDLERLIKAVDEQIRLTRDFSFYQEIFLNLIALIGEAANEKTGSRWSMKLSDDDNVTWNTFLTMKNQIVVFHTNLYEDIFLSDYENEFLAEDVYLTVLDIVKINIA